MCDCLSDNLRNPTKLVCIMEDEVNCIFRRPNYITVSSLCILIIFAQLLGMICNIQLHQKSKLYFRDKIHHIHQHTCLLGISLKTSYGDRRFLFAFGFGCYFYTAFNLKKYNIKITVCTLKVSRKECSVTAYQLYHNQIYLIFLLTQFEIGLVNAAFQF